MKTQYNPLSDIHNSLGFKFVGLTKDDREILCEVEKRNGTYTLKWQHFPLLKAWRFLSEHEQEHLNPKGNRL